MKAQTVFDRTAEHLLTQGGRSAVPNSSGGQSCLYRGPKGRKCPVGFWITDRDYRPEMEGISIGIVVGRFNVPEVLRDYLLLLTVFQSIHDFTHPNGWRKALRQLAKGHGLEFREDS